MFQKSSWILKFNRSLDRQKPTTLTRAFQSSTLNFTFIKILGLTALAGIFFGLGSRANAQPHLKKLPAPVDSTTQISTAPQPDPAFTEDTAANTTESDRSQLELPPIAEPTEIAQADLIEPGTPPLPEPEIPEPLPPPDELLEPSSPTDIPSDLENIPGTINVDRYEVIGSTVFSQEEFDEVLKDFRGEISFAELLQARSAVTKLYTENGYVTSGALIPPQALENGVVQIEVVEGSLEELIVEVDGRLNDDY
ncbi:MAG: hypothetical protein D6728_13565, partial [Cyanobacteria bacterium J055]